MNWDVAWKSLSILLRLWEESAAGSGGHVNNRLLEVEFTMAKRLPKVEVMWRIGFWKWNSLWRSICQNWRSCEELLSIEVEFNVTKHLPKVEVMWKIGFWKWYSLWRNVCQKWRSCEEPASGSGIHCDEAATKSEAAAECFSQGCIMKNASWPMAKFHQNLCSPHEHQP